MAEEGEIPPECHLQFTAISPLKAPYLFLPPPLNAGSIAGYLVSLCVIRTESRARSYQLSAAPCLWELFVGSVSLLAGVHSSLSSRKV